MKALNPWDYCAFGNVLDINTITFCEWAQAKCVMQMYVLTWNWCAFLNNITAPFVWIVNNFLKLDIVVLSLMAQLKLYESWILPQAILTVSLLEVVSPNRLEHEKLFVFGVIKHLMENRYHRFYKIWSKVLNFSEDIFTRTNQGDKEDDGANASFMKVCRIVVLYGKWKDDGIFTLTLSYVLPYWRSWDHGLKSNGQSAEYKVT